MTILQAAAISKTNNLPIRRSSWPEDKWFWVWLGGHWFSYPEGKPHTALSTDYTKDDLLADDWTTVPASLASCPITTTEPNGGNEPQPGVGLFPDDSSTALSSSGSSSGGGSSLSLPSPDNGTSITVDFEGIEIAAGTPSLSDWLKSGAPRGRKVAHYAGPGHWNTTMIKGGQFDDGSGPPYSPFEVFYELDVTLNSETKLYTVSLTSNMIIAGGVFLTSTPGAHFRSIDNASTGNFFGGTATVI